MGRGKGPIEIGGVAFASKAAAQRHIRGIVNDAPIGPLSGEAFEFVLALLQRHSRAETKIGCGVASISVRAVQPYGTRCFWITRHDGTETDFSWHECLSPSSQEDKFLRACRNTVRPQVAAAKASPPERCPITGEELGPDNLHVDHAEPWTFEAIVDAFVRERGLNIETLDLDGDEDGEVVQRFADAALATDFAEFHEKRANLRCVSVRANLSVLRRGRGD